MLVLISKLEPDGLVRKLGPLALIPARIHIIQPFSCIVSSAQRNGWLQSWVMKWIWVVVLAIIGILAAIVAIEYFVVPIHSLPSYIPGYHHHKRGHYHKRGAIAALIAVIGLGAAGYLSYRFLRSQHTVRTEPSPTPPVEGSSADQLLSDPPAASGDTPAD